MSKNLTRKGIAFGALVALAGSVIAGMPAQADTTGPVTLVPNTGSGFNSILQSGITLKSNIDPSVGVEEAGSLAFLIGNAGAANITADLQTLGTADELLKYESDTDPATTAVSPVLSNNARQNTGSPVSSESTTNKFLYVTGSSQTTGNFQAAIDAGTAEVQTYTSATMTNSKPYSLTLPNGKVLTYTTDASAAIAEVVAGLKADADYDSNYAVIAVANTNDITITYAKQFGNVTPAVLSIDGAAALTNTETTAGNNANWNFGSTFGANKLVLTTAETTKNVTLTVQAWLDADGDGQIDYSEKSSDKETVILYAAGNVTATTKIIKAQRDSDEIKATVVFGNGINSTMVEPATAVAFYKNGTTFEIDDATTAVGSASAGTNYSAGEGTLTDVIVNSAGVALDADDVITATAYSDVDIDPAAGGAATSWRLGSGVYTARAVYTGTATNDVFVGVPSASIDLANGTNTLVTGATVSVEDSDNTTYDATPDAKELQVRTGTKSILFTAQAIKAGPLNLEAADVKVKAVVTGRTITTGNSLSVSGAVGTITAKDGTLTAYAFTDSKGKANFTVTAGAGTKSDAFDVAISVIDKDGLWVAADQSDVDVIWEDAALTTFTAKPGTYVSGANVTVDIHAKDQFRVGMDSNEDGAFSVRAVALIGGTPSSSTLDSTVVTSKGKASFSFKNFAAAGSTAQLQASLIQAGSVVSGRVLLVNVYNTLATDKITVADTYVTDVTYVDFVTGDYTVPATKLAIDKAGLVDAAKAPKATITGTVLNASGVGQPGIAVELSAAGYLFKAADIYATDKITAYANEFGQFSVDVFAHKVVNAGAKISITADGKTASTLLKSYLPDELTEKNLKFSVSVPALLVKNTTYAVVASLSDKWGNPIAATDATPADRTNFAVSFIGTGSAEINSSAALVYKDFGKDGKATVFVRSVKDIAGPGAIAATLGSEWTYVGYSAGAENTSDSAALAATTATDDTATAWDETAWAKELSVNVDILEKKPTASISKGTKSTTVVVKNANGTTIKVVRGTKSKTVAADANTEKVTLKGGTGKVTVYVNGVKIASK